MFLTRIILTINCIVTFFFYCYGFLYPYESETRQTKSLNGIWKFKISPEFDQDRGFKEKWFNSMFNQDFINIPVPSSFNDVTTNDTIRDFVGWVWYQTEFYVTTDWKQKTVILHFGGVHYFSKIWINGVLAGAHKGGHVPFNIIISDYLTFKKRNLLTVAVNNTLNENTIPQGFITYPNDTNKYPSGYRLYSHSFDYFDYAGINRNVFLYVIPKNYISNIQFETSYTGSTGFIDYLITKEGDGDCYTTLLDDKEKAVAKTKGCHSMLNITKVNLWWPIFSNHSKIAYLYTLVVFLDNNKENDIYRLPIGIRTIKWTSNDSLTINNENVYLRGFGMHEDSDIRGRGFDNVILLKDFNLLNWIGANTIRTSHYPYSKEFLQMADQNGLLVILETPACSLNYFGEDILVEHERILIEIIVKYTSHPSIIMWSLANEPSSDLIFSTYYFSKLVEVVKALDSTRPVTFVTSQQIINEKAISAVDIICLNRYSGWYESPGNLNLITYQIANEIRLWHKKFNKKVILTEYGAGSLSGFHNLPASMWSEDYQVELLKRHFEVFSELRKEKILIGELIWNLIDFNTPQEYVRPGKCAKGIFTRQRQPKSSAYVVRNHYRNL